MHILKGAKNVEIYQQLVHRFSLWKCWKVENVDFFLFYYLLFLNFMVLLKG